MTALGERMSVSGTLQSLLLEMGQQRALDGVLGVVVDRLAEEEHIALARIWMSLLKMSSEPEATHVWSKPHRMCGTLRCLFGVFDPVRPA